jgi:hypothetical protein
MQRDQAGSPDVVSDLMFLQKLLGEILQVPFGEGDGRGHGELVDTCKGIRRISDERLTGGL